MFYKPKRLKNKNTEGYNEKVFKKAVDHSFDETNYKINYIILEEMFGKINFNLQTSDIIKLMDILGAKKTESLVSSYLLGAYNHLIVNQNDNTRDVKKVKPVDQAEELITPVKEQKFESKIEEQKFESEFEEFLIPIEGQKSESKIEELITPTETKEAEDFDILAHMINYLKNNGHLSNEFDIESSNTDNLEIIINPNSEEKVLEVLDTSKRAYLIMEYDRVNAEKKLENLLMVQNLKFVLGDGYSLKVLGKKGYYVRALLPKKGSK